VKRAFPLPLFSENYDGYDGYDDVEIAFIYLIGVPGGSAREIRGGFPRAKTCFAYASIQDERSSTKSIRKAGDYAY